MIKAPGYRLLVRPDEIKKQTSSGILIEYAENEKLEKGARITGTVVEVGPEAFRMHLNPPKWQFWKKRLQPWCKVGDQIFWAKYAGKQVVDPETQIDYIILNDEDCVGVLVRE